MRPKLQVPDVPVFQNLPASSSSVPDVPVFQNLPASSSSSTSSDSSPSSASIGFDFDRGDQTYLNDIVLDASLIKSSLPSSAASTAGFSHSVRINYSLSRSNLQLLNSKLKLILSVLLIRSGIDSGTPVPLIATPSSLSSDLSALQSASLSSLASSAASTAGFSHSVRITHCQSLSLALTCNC